MRENKWQREARKPPIPVSHIIAAFVGVSTRFFNVMSGGRTEKHGVIHTHKLDLAAELRRVSVYYKSRPRPWRSWSGHKPGTATRRAAAVRALKSVTCT